MGNFNQNLIWQPFHITCTVPNGNSIAALRINNQHRGVLHRGPHQTRRQHRTPHLQTRRKSLVFALLIHFLICWAGVKDCLNAKKKKRTPDTMFEEKKKESINHHGKNEYWKPAASTKHHFLFWSFTFVLSCACGYSTLHMFCRRDKLSRMFLGNGIL